MRTNLMLSLVLVFSIAACKDDKTPGRCFQSSDCRSGQICALFASSARVCVDRCDTAAASLCADGRACVATTVEDAQVDVCVPGGATPVGSGCATSVECVDGSICVLIAGAAASTCEQLCDVGGADVCGTTQVCTALDASVSTLRGVCVTAP